MFILCCVHRWLQTIDSLNKLQSFRELCQKTNFSSKKIRSQFEIFNRHFPDGVIKKDDIEDTILTVLPEKYSDIIR